MRRPSVRRLTAISTLITAIVAGMVAAALIWTSALLDRALDTVIRDAQGRAVADEIELALLLYQRVSNSYVATGEPELEETRASLAAELESLLARAEVYTASAREQRSVEAVERSLNAYLLERPRLEARGLQLGEIVRSSGPPLSQTLDDIEALRALNDAQVQEAAAEARQVNALSMIAGVIAAAFLVFGVLGVAVGVRRSMLRPMLALHEAMRRFRRGDTDSRVAAGGLREVDELSQGFNEMAESLARQREEQLTFLAGVAHDLRNPLAGIKMGIHALERGSSESERDRVRARLDRQVDRLARMVDDLLDATRIEAGELEIRCEELDLRRVVEEMVALYAPTSPAHQIAARLPEAPVTIHGDPLRIEQVLSNFLSNAIKFSPEGGAIVIGVATEGGDALLSVTDSGIGIPREEIATLFLPFRRRRPDVAPGAGLGLSVVRRIVTAHDGTIEVDSAPGAGSTFRVRVPLADQGRVEPSPPALRPPRRVSPRA